MATVTRIEGGFISVKLGSVAKKFQRLVLGTDGEYDPAGLTDLGDVIADEDGAVGDVIVARLINAQGTQFGLADIAVASAGLPLYSAADGEVSTTKGTDAVLVGKSMHAAGANEAVSFIGV